MSIQKVRKMKTFLLIHIDKYAEREYNLRKVRDMKTMEVIEMRTADYNSVVPLNISRIIQETGVKQCVIAERAGYTKQQFNSMLNGRKIIKATDILRIAKALNVTPNDLYGISAKKAV